jgi:hypothetical protein
LREDKIKIIEKRFARIFIVFRNSQLGQQKAILENIFLISFSDSIENEGDVMYVTNDAGLKALTFFCLGSH